MRWLTNDESGAMAVVVAVLMGFLLVLVALVVDTGRLYDERRQLQNGADAAALAIAFDCARDGATCTATASARAAEWASANAADSLSAIDPTSPLAQNPLVDFSARTVTVDTRSQEPGQAAADGELPFIVEWPDGRTSQPVRARAVAAWGAAGQAPSIPVTFSRCQYEDLEAAGGWDHPVTMDFKDSSGGGSGPYHCDPGPGHPGFDAPGSYGSLVPEDPTQPPNVCPFSPAAITVLGSPTTEEWVEWNKGADFNDVARCLNVGEIITFPVFYDFCRANQSPKCRDITPSPGLDPAHGGYEVGAYVAVRIIGWRFGGEQGGSAPCGDQGNQARCIEGQFVPHTVTGGVINPDLEDLGVRTAKLIR